MSKLISKENIKRLLKGVLVVIVLFGLALLATTSEEATTSEDTRDVFTEALSPRHVLVDEVRWLTDAPGLARNVDANTRDKIAEAWIGALEAIGSTGPESQEIAATYLAGPALRGVNNGQQLDEAIQTEHTLKIEFISADGQIVSISAPETKRLARYLVDESETFARLTESYQAVLILEDGNWRINHLVKLDSDLTWLGQ